MMKKEFGNDHLHSRLGSDSNTILGEIYEKRGDFWMNGRNTSDLPALQIGRFLGTGLSVLKLK